MVVRFFVVAVVIAVVVINVVLIFRLGVFNSWFLFCFLCDYFQSEKVGF